MSTNVDVPYTRRNVSALSQRSATAAQQHTPRPINESMVREHLSVNLPDSFRYLNNTLPMGSRKAKRHNHRHHHNAGSSSSSSDGSDHRDSDGNNNGRVGRAAQSGENHRAVNNNNGQQRQRRSRPPTPPSRSSSSSSSDDSDDNVLKHEANFNFYARLVKLDNVDTTDTAAAAAGNGSPLTTPVVAQCCDTVRGAMELLHQVRLATGEAEQRDKFFWLDLHGVPPPLPGTAEWATQPQRWRRRQLAALRDATQTESAVEGVARPHNNNNNNNSSTIAADGSGRQKPEVDIAELWKALGLQPTTIAALTEVCRQRQADPTPGRTSLDDIYEEEVMDLHFPDDRIVQVEPLLLLPKGGKDGSKSNGVERGRGKGDAAAAAAVLSTARREGPHASPSSPPPAVASAAAAAANVVEQPQVGGTHYVLMELATLLTCVPATAVKGSVGAWSSSFLSQISADSYAHEPFNDNVWTENLARSMHMAPAGYKAGAALRAREGHRGGSAAVGSRGNRQLTQINFHTAELQVTPLITSTYVLCFPGGCVTWCPGSTLGLVSAERRERQREAAQQQRRNGRGDRHAASHGSTNSDASSDDDENEDRVDVQYVKSWDQLQASVFHRLRHMTLHKGRTAAPTASQSSAGHNAGVGATTTPTAAASRAAAGTAPALSTSGFVSLLLSAVCYAYLPNTTSVLSEVDAIDSMLPLVGLNVESDQADALRRVLLLRRRLAVHRRLLFQKTRLLEALDGPALHTLARFVRTVKVPSWVWRAEQANWQRQLTRSSAANTVRSEEGVRCGSDVDLISNAATPGVLEDHQTGGGVPGAGGGAAAAGIVPMVHFTDGKHEETPWAVKTAEETYGSASSQSRRTWTATGGDGGDGAAAASDHQRRGRRSGKGNNGGGGHAGRAALRMAEPPSLNAIHKGISNVLHSLETARSILGNTTLIYSSTVNFNNSRTSESADYFALICQYVLLIVLPLNIVASQWGMNCAVPFKYVEGTTPFWSIVGVMIFVAIAGLALPIYAYRSGNIKMIS